MWKTLFVPPAQGARASTGLLLLRLFAGYAFMVHGWGKIQHPFSWMGPNSGYPAVVQFLGAFSEFGGGLAWLREHGVQVVDLRSAECIEMLGDYIRANPAVWHEDIGEP